MRYKRRMKRLALIALVVRDYDEALKRHYAEGAPQGAGESA